jgi:hypothetical protein
MMQTPSASSFQLFRISAFQHLPENPGLPHARLAHQNQIVLPALQQDLLVHDFLSDDFPRMFKLPLRIFSTVRLLGR